MIPAPKNEQIKLVLPWGITVNHYWITRGKRRFLSPEARAFRESVMAIASPYLHWFGDTRIAVHIDAYPPDGRRRDIDNLLKCALDSLQHARVFNDDNQVDRLSIWRHKAQKNLSSMMVVTITPC